MPQAAPAPMITPNRTITINNQTPSQDSVTINVGQILEIHNEDNVAYQLPISYLSGDSTNNYPLALYIPAGGKLDFIGWAAATCEYNIVAAPSLSGREGHALGNGPYTIGVNSSEPGGGKK
ncbi:MAG TPA: hypothetical protein VGR93_04560 [Candidatus Acidoferrales bacterium]|nr:hypothetical protein [Candidatus Acidoferrales bacterium]